MNNYRIFVSSTQAAEDVTIYTVESEESLETVVKAAALKAVIDMDIDADDIERIDFNFYNEDKYVIVITCVDFHISVWCDNSDFETVQLDNKLIALAKNIKDGTYYDVDDTNYNEEIWKLVNKASKILND